MQPIGKVLHRTWEDARRHWELASARSISTCSIRSVCLFLGPYRNLTTLTASLLFLHPRCQVLNHAAARIFGDPRLDFLADYSERRFNDFMRYAIHASRGGRRGQFGGSITHSHAFDEQYLTRELFEAAGGHLVKPVIHSLVWKESLRTSLHLRHLRVDLDLLFARNPRLRFLLPVRNPIDVAVSSLKTGHVNLFDGLNQQSPVERVVDAILDEHAWVESLRARHPERFFVYFDNEFDRRTVLRLADFLSLAPEEQWVRRALALFEVKKRYRHPREWVEHYRKAVEERFDGSSDFGAKLLRFTDEVESCPAGAGVDEGAHV
jgi:hypothetical protein